MELLVGIEPRQFIRVAVALIDSVSNEQVATITRPDTGEHLNIMPLRAASAIANIAANINDIPQLPDGHVPPYVLYITLRHAVTVINQILDVANDEEDTPYIRMLQASIDLLRYENSKITPFVYPPAFPPPAFPPVGGKRRRTRRHRVRKARTVRRRTVHRR